MGLGIDPRCGPVSPLRLVWVSRQVRAVFTGLSVAGLSETHDLAAFIGVCAGLVSRSFQTFCDFIAGFRCVV